MKLKWRKNDNSGNEIPKEKYYIKKDGRIINRCIIRNFYSK